MPDKHARLSCSAAKRWINCPGSVMLAERFPDKSSDYADEGTLAHSLAEKMIGGGRIGKKLKDDVTAFYDEHPKMDGSFDAMKKILQPYADYCTEEFTAQLRKDPSAKLLTEQQVDLSDYIPGGFGTSDVVIVREGYLHIIDLKYGKGVPVFAEGNPQLRLYALGTLSMLDMIYGIKDVVMTIYQPRLDNISTAQMTADELYEWGETVIKPAARLALTEDAPLGVGDWCQFCPARSRCKARSDHYMEMNQLVNRKLLSDEETGYILSQVDDLVKWAEDVKKDSLERIMSGEEIPGWKAVEGRSIRVFTGSPEELEKAMDALGYNPTLLYERKMLGITAVEKIVGKKEFAEGFKGLVDKPEGKPTLAPESDKRPALATNRYQKAAEDFAD